MFSSIKTWIAIIAVLCLVGYAGYKEFQTKSLKSEVALLEANSAILKSALEDSNAAFNALKAENIKIRKLYEEANSSFKEIDSNTAKAHENISKLFIDETSFLDVNRIFEETMRCMELATGSPLTLKEKEAKNAEEFNSTCPWYFDTVRVQP